MASIKEETAKNKIKAEEPVSKDDIGFQSFLVPTHYRNQSLYRSDSIFRISLFGIILFLVASGITTAQWIKAQKLTETFLQVQNLETEESTRLQTQSHVYRPIREKFRELESLRKQLRVPLTPILDAIEKTIPPEISINRISTSCPPIASTSTVRRKMQVQLEIFIPTTISSDNPIIGNWPEELSEYLEKSGLLVTERSWGQTREYKRLREDSRKKRVTQAVGATKDLNLTIELKPE